MNYLTYIKMALSTLFIKGRRNLLKIITLTLGLAVGLVLAAKVCFEQTYDDFYTDADRIVYVRELAEQNGELATYPQTSGGTAITMKEHYPEIEEASRITFFESEASLIDVETDERYSAHSVNMADSCFFKVLDRKCLAGNITASLGIRNNVVISSTIAQKMTTSKDARMAAQEALGRKFTIASRGSDVVLTISGVYEDFPTNASLRPDIIISLPTIGSYMYDGSEGLLGNDRYKSFLKLKKGIDVETLNAKMDDYVNSYLPIEEIKAANVWISYLLKPYTGYHYESQDVRNTTLVLGIVALALLMVSVLNYMLIVISTSVTRSKEIALRRCLGSSMSDTAKMMFAEALIHTTIAVILAMILLIVAKGYVENFLGIGLGELFTGKPLVLACGIALIVMILNGLAPTYIFNRISIATIFRNYRANRRRWKMWLLIVEFALVAFQCVLIGTISKQYNKMITAELGFSCENIVELATPEGTLSQHKVLMEELRAQPEVEDVCFSFLGAFPGYSGNNVRIQGRADDLFNAQDMYYVDDHWFNVMEVEIIEGRNFNTELSSDNEVIVDTRFADKLRAMTGWNDVLGRQVEMSEHGMVTIVGVIGHIDFSRFSKEAESYYGRPMAIFYCNPDEPKGKYHYPFQFVKYHKLTSEAMEHTREVCERVLPRQTVFLNPFKTAMLSGLSDTLETRNFILVGSIITLLVAIMGLIGYVIDEIKRRAKEIAVRRVNGAQFSQIRLLFQRDTMRIAIPSALLGCVVGVVVALRWEQNFTIQIGMPWWIIFGSIIFTIGVVLLVTDIFVGKIANANPARSIKTE